MGQKRSNKRKLETFVDAKYIDKRTRVDKKLQPEKVAHLENGPPPLPETDGRGRFAKRV